MREFLGSATIAIWSASFCVSSMWNFFLRASMEFQMGRNACLPVGEVTASLAVIVIVSGSEGRLAGNAFEAI